VFITGKKVEKNNNTKMVEILRRLKPEMHGAAVEDMARRGISYGLSYGVAVPVIRKVAREYAPDPALAAYLFRQDVRELKLAAVYVDNPGQVTATQMRNWASAMPAPEIMEHAAMNLFYASPDAVEIIMEWLDDNDPLRLKGALYMAGKRATERLDMESVLSDILVHAGKAISEKSHVPQQAAVYFFTKLAGITDGLCTHIMEILDAWQKQESPELRDLASEIVAFLEV